MGGEWQKGSEKYSERGGIRSPGGPPENKKNLSNHDWVLLVIRL